MKNNMVGWFEIPVDDMDRAIHFYEAVFDIEIDRQPMGELDMGWFPWVEDGLGSPGSLVKSEGFYKPCSDGALVYFTAHSGDLNNELARIEPAGGKVLMTKKKINDEYGYMALCLDSEGNRIALHSRN